MSNFTYIDSQDKKDAIYKKEWHKWINSLTQEEREHLEESGVDLVIPNYNTWKQDDTETLSRSSDNTSFTVNTSLTPEMSDAKIWDVLRRLIGEILSKKNAQLSLECFAVISGVSFLGDSETEIAKRNGVTRAAVSKRCIELSDKLNMTPSRSMKSKQARISYSKARKKNL